MTCIHPIFIISSVKRSSFQAELPERHIDISDFIKYIPDLHQISRALENLGYNILAPLRIAFSELQSGVVSFAYS